MNILIVSTVNYETNGISHAINNLYCNKIIQDNKMVFLLPSGSDSSMIKELKYHNYKVYLSNRSKKHILKYIYNIKKIIKTENIDIIHIHGNSHTVSIELLAAKTAGCKVRIVHAHSSSCKHKLLHKLLTTVFNRLYTHGLACGVEAGKFMYGNKPFTVINNGIDTTCYAFNESERQLIREKYNINDKIVIGHVGNFLEVKNQSFLVDIIKELQNQSDKYILMLIGDGKTKSYVENKALGLGVKDKIIFTGTIKNVSEYLSACDLIVMPSLFEGFPLTLVEEQTNGLKCICSNTITKEVNLTGNVSFISLNENSKVWADAIRKVDCNYDRNVASIESIEKIRKAGYCIEDQVIKLERFYKDAIISTNNK